MSCDTCIHFIVCDAHRKHNGIGMRLCGLYTDKRRYCTLPDFAAFGESVKKIIEAYNGNKEIDIENLESEVYKE